MHVLARLAIVTALAISGASAHAVATFDFAGTIDFTRLGFTAGQAVSGRLSYDDTLADVSPDPQFGQFGQPGPGAVRSLELSIAGNGPVHVALGDSRLLVNLFGAHDVVSIGAMEIGFGGGFSGCSLASACLLELQFRDPSNTAIASNAPADAMPGAGQLGRFPIIAGNIVGFDAALGTVTSVQFTITELTARVAEPDGLMLVSLGGALLLGFGTGARESRRSRRGQG